VVSCNNCRLSGGRLTGPLSNLNPERESRSALLAKPLDTGGTACGISDRGAASEELNDVAVM
jgi:hypothetical protein